MLQFAIPCRWLPGGTKPGTAPDYLYIAPGVEFSWWEQEYSDGFGRAVNLFGAYCDFGMRPRLTENFALDAWIRVGVYSDYEKVTGKSWRVQGRAMGIFKISDRWQGTVGGMYLDRAKVKILPSGGVIWMPNDDYIFKLTFPDPKISMRIPTAGAVEWWGYVQGDYGGGSWTTTDYYDGLDDKSTLRMDYNDIRLGIGVEFDNPACLSGFAEIGGAFAREVVLAGHGTWKPSDAFYFRVGLLY